MKPLPPAIGELVAPSEYLQEVLATPPRWIIRWGELLVFLLVLGLLLLGWLIRYPDRIPAEAIITTTQPPVSVVARSEGALSQLLVQDGAAVSKDELLAVIQNAADYSHVVQLKKQLATFDLSDGTADVLFSNVYHLGALQEGYAQLQRAEKDYRLYQRLNPHYQQQQAVGRQLKQYRALLNQKANHQRLLERKVQLAEKDYQRNEHLHALQTIADKALEDAERAWLEVRETYETLRTELLQTKVQVADLEREWQRLRTQHSQEGEQLRTNLLTSVDQLRSEIAHWEERYLLTAPRSGQVSFADFWSEQQFVQAGQTVMHVIPLDGYNQSDLRTTASVAVADFDSSASTQMVVARLRVPVRNFGKVTVGQAVQIYLENFPHQQYGTLQGTVHSLSALPKQGYYRVTVTFPKGLTTQYGKEIPFTQQLSGKAEIVTEELRLLERLFYQLRSAMNSAG